MAESSEQANNHNSASNSGVISSTTTENESTNASASLQSAGEASSSQQQSLPEQEQPSDEPQKEEWEIQRDHHKQAGDQAFRCGGFLTAIDEYSKSISLDPDFIVAYSNRSAAYLKNNEKSKALKDAEMIVNKDPTFVKGHSRLAAALHALRRYPKALESYEEVLKLDPPNKAAKAGVDDCQKHILEIKREEQEKKDREQKEEEEAAAAKKEAEEEAKAKEESGGGDDDDLLDDFFAEVEEVTTKKTVEEDKPKATNLIKNDRETLGTSETQMEFLLKSNYEWRNLNPFYVLQLPHDATEDDISRRYKALSLLLHPDKNGGSDRAQLAYDQVQNAKTTLNDPDRAKHLRQLIEEGLKQGELIWNKKSKSEKKSSTLEDTQEKEVMRIFAMIEKKRRDVEERERKFEQRTQQQEDDELEKERQARQFDKKWREEDRVGKRVGNWRDFAGGNKKKKSKSS